MPSYISFHVSPLHVFARQQLQQHLFLFTVLNSTCRTHNESIIPIGFDSLEKYWGPAKTYAYPRRHLGIQFVRKKHNRNSMCSAASYLLKYMETLQHVYLQFWLLFSGFCSLHTSCISQGRNHLSCLILAHQSEWTVHQEPWSSPGMHFHPALKWTYPENKWELNKKGNTQQLS